MTGRNFGWGDKSITTKWNFISKVDSKIYKSLKELTNHYGMMFLFFLFFCSRWSLFLLLETQSQSVVFWGLKSRYTFGKQGVSVTPLVSMWHFWKSWSNYGPLGFISKGKLFKVQNLMADKIACRISLLHSFSSAKWFKELGAGFK